MTDATKPPPKKHLPHGNYARADWFEMECARMTAVLADRTTANVQLAAIGQRQFDRIVTLEAKLAEIAEMKEHAIKLWDDWRKERARRLQLEAALEPFRHMRMMFDAERPMADCEITNLIDGTVCTIGYARSAKEANDFDEIFERARAALPSAPSTQALCPHGFVLADNTCGPCSEGRPTRTPGWAEGGPFIFGKEQAV